jgi:hypothetical protein
MMGDLACRHGEIFYQAVEILTVLASLRRVGVFLKRVKERGLRKSFEARLYVVLVFALSRLARCLLERDAETLGTSNIIASTACGRDCIALANVAMWARLRG